MNAPFTHPDLPVTDTPPLAADPVGLCVASVALIVPVHNDEDAIAPFLEAVYRNTELLTEQGIVFDFIFVNDGSTDATLDCLLLAQRDDPRIRVIDLSRGFGRDAALTAGLDLCHADAAIPMRIDLRDPPHVIPDLIDKWREGYEVVRAKPAEAGMSLSARIGKLLPEQGGEAGEFRLIDRHVIDALRTLPERSRFMSGLFDWVGFNAATIVFAGDPAPPSLSGGRLRGLGRGSLTSFSTMPLELWTYAGAAIACLSFLYGIAVVGKTLVFGADVPGYASLLASVLFLGGVQLLGIGVLGRYLGRVYSEIKQRPVYIVRRTFDAG